MYVSSGRENCAPKSQVLCITGEGVWQDPETSLSVSTNLGQDQFYLSPSSAQFLKTAHELP